MKSTERTCDVSKPVTFNESKSKIAVKVQDLLRYQVSQGQIQSDPSHLQPLLAVKPPSSLKELKRVCGLFAYYARWIATFRKVTTTANGKGISFDWANFESI